MSAFSQNEFYLKEPVDVFTKLIRTKFNKNRKNKKEKQKQAKFRQPALLLQTPGKKLNGENTF